MYLKDLQVSEEELLSGLLRNGAISLPLINPNLLPGIIQEAESAKFHKLPREVGKHKTRQEMEVWRVENRRSRFWLLAGELTQRFSNHCVSARFIEEFALNTVEVLRYPLGSIGIEPHLDSAKYVNLIFLCNLTGGGKFVTCSDRVGSNPVVHRCEPGDVVIMRGMRLFGQDGRPFHYVPPVTAKRLVCSIRQTATEAT